MRWFLDGGLVRFPHTLGPHAVTANAPSTYALAMKLYSDLASWYPLLTPLEEYAVESQDYLRAFRAMLGPGRHSLLELGTGAGHNAHYFQGDFDLHLTDVSPQMLALTHKTCPDAQRTLGDMRTLRLPRTFDAVFVHDAVCYMRTPQDVAAMLATCRAHLEKNGVLLIAPDAVTETFAPTTDCCGTDGDGRALRYLEWVWQRPGQVNGYTVDYTVVTREGDALPNIHHDRHEEGLFPLDAWKEWIHNAGFSVELAPRTNPDDGSDLLLLACRAL